MVCVCLARTCMVWQKRDSPSVCVCRVVHTHTRARDPRPPPFFYTTSSLFIYLCHARLLKHTPSAAAAEMREQLLSRTRFALLMLMREQKFLFNVVVVFSFFRLLLVLQTIIFSISFNVLPRQRTFFYTDILLVTILFENKFFFKFVFVSCCR